MRAIPNGGLTGISSICGNDNTAVVADHVTVVGDPSSPHYAAGLLSCVKPGVTASLSFENSVLFGGPTSLSCNGPYTQVSMAYFDYGFASAQNNGCSVVASAGNLDNVDPQFVSPTDAHLAITSPLRDAGRPGSPKFPTDRDGHPRLGTQDIGAYELQTAAPAPAAKSKAASGGRLPS